MVGTDHNPLAIDIAAYTLTEYVPAKPLDSNIEVSFDVTENTLQAEPCGQLRCGDSLKFPFARAGYLPISVPIEDAVELVSANKSTQTKRVVELTLDIQSLKNLEYDPGDTIAILANNSYEVVDKLLQRLNCSDRADDLCQVKLPPNCTKKSAKIPAHIPTTTTIREIFTHCVSLQSVLQKQFLSALAGCTTDGNEKAFLSSLSAKQGAAHYQTLILERGLNLLDLLELCGSCMPTLSLLVEHLPRLLPRPYSIANSPLEGAQKLRIIYSILPQRPGVTTSMLESKVQAMKERPAKIFIYPRIPNTFHYINSDRSNNQILIAVGTGLAPFLGFLAHKQLGMDVASGQTWLYVGAKSAAAIIKQQQLLSWQEAQVLQRLRTCYSRTSKEGEPKYVQELLEQDAKELVELWLESGTVLYVCADGARISKSIEEGLRRCLERTLQLEEALAFEKLKEMRAQGKYREDIWL